MPLHLFGLRCLTLDTLTLGGLPATLGGVKHVRTGVDAVVVDVEFKLAGGDPNIVLTAHTLAGAALPLAVREALVPKVKVAVPPKPETSSVAPAARVILEPAASEPPVPKASVPA